MDHGTILTTDGARTKKKTIVWKNFSWIYCQKIADGAPFDSIEVRKYHSRYRWFYFTGWLGLTGKSELTNFIVLLWLNFHKYLHHLVKCNLRQEIEFWKAYRHIKPASRLINYVTELSWMFVYAFLEYTFDSLEFYTHALFCRKKFDELILYLIQYNLYSIHLCISDTFKGKGTVLCVHLKFNLLYF